MHGCVHFNSTRLYVTVSPKGELQGRHVDIRFELPDPGRDYSKGKVYSSAFDVSLSLVEG